MPRLTLIGLDADDTLWQNEPVFRLTHRRFAGLLADHADPERLEALLLAAEARNLGQYGFGIKGFTLSMIETAIEVTEGRVPAGVIGEIIAAGKEMLRHPVELLPGVEAAVDALAERHPLVLITKGDLLDQERKLAQSGLGDRFAGVEIVSDKTAAVYAGIFARRGSRPEASLMAGNSLRSDVIPVLEAGGHGVHVPHELTWVWEMADAPAPQPRFHVLPDLGGLAGLVARIEAG